MNENLKFQLKFNFSFLVVLLNLFLIVLFLPQRFSLPSMGLIVSSNAKVGFVDPFGPVNNTVHIGDSIISINGFSIVDEPNLAEQALLNNYNTGETINFEFAKFSSINQSEEAYQIALTLQPSSWLMIFFQLSPVFVALSFWLVGLLFIFFQPSGKIQRYLFIFCQFWTAFLTFSANPFLREFGLHHFYPAITLATVLITVLLHLHFPVAVSETSRRSLLTFIVGIVILEGLFEIVAMISGNEALNVVLNTVRPLLLILSLLIALYMIGHAYFVSEKADEKRQIGLIIIGACIAILPLFVFCLLPDIFQGYPLLPYELVVYLFAAIPISYGYAIWKFNFVKIEKYVSRTSTIIISTTLILGLYFILSYLFLQQITPSATSRSIYDVVFMILPVLLFAPFYDRVQKGIDRIFYGGWYSFSSVVEEVSARLEKVDDSTTMPQILSQTVQQLMRLKWTGLYFPTDNDDLVLSAHSGDLPQALLTTVLPKGGALVSHLASLPIVQKTAQLSQSLIGQPLAIEESALLNNEDVTLFVPISGLKTSIGLFILGAKETGDPFDFDDFKILDIISRLTSVTFRNFQLIQELEEKAVENEQYKREVLRVRDEERKHISRELHDQIIQELVGINYQIKRLDREMPVQSDETILSIGDLQAGVGSLIQTTRLLCQDLRPPALDLGIIPSVRSVVSKFETKSDTAVDLIVDGDRDIQIDENIALCLYRCISEALENIFKHAQASHIVVEINISKQQVSFSVSDNGRGFNKPPQLGELMKWNHYGLVGMRERIELLNGKFDLTTQPQNGTTIEASIPINNNSHLWVNSKKIIA